jgi:hypothetical protein
VAYLERSPAEDALVRLRDLKGKQFDCLIYRQISIQDYVWRVEIERRRNDTQLRELLSFKTGKRSLALLSHYISAHVSSL